MNNNLSKKRRFHKPFLNFDFGIFLFLYAALYLQSDLKTILELRSSMNSKHANNYGEFFPSYFKILSIQHNYFLLLKEIGSFSVFVFHYTVPHFFSLNNQMIFLFCQVNLVQDQFNFFLRFFAVNN